MNVYNGISANGKMIKIFHKMIVKFKEQKGSIQTVATLVLMAQLQV